MKALDLRRGYIRIGMVLLLVAAVAATVFFFTRTSQVQAKGEAKEGGEPSEEGVAAVSVKSVHPRLDKNFQMTVDRPADVEAYYWADIEAQVPGVARMIRVASGSRVKKDQLLVELDVPDLVASLHEKTNAVGQRQKEVEAAEAKRDAARIAIKTAEANLKLTKTELQRAQADTLYRQRDHERQVSLWRRTAVEEAVVDIARRALGVAQATEAAARASQEKAESEVEDARANLTVMETDVLLKKQLVKVAEAELEKARAMREFARIKAPFEGTVVSRKIDPGSFVQNASTREPKPILSLERTDIVTVVMRVPDNFAPYISDNTEAVIELDALPGLKIHGRVTRFAPSLVTSDNARTMRVEVDLWNDDPAKFEAFMARTENRDNLKDGLAPLLPRVSGSNPLRLSTHLLPGMYGKMSLILRTFADTHLIPSQAIIRKAGRPFIWVAKDGKAHLMPVAVQVDDGKMARVEQVGEDNEVKGDLKADTEVIVSNQEELFEGLPVKTALEVAAPQDKKSPH